jgi:FtsH-binding integral membrane protein
LLFAAASSFAVQSMAIYLRSFKREPYLIQSMAVAVLTVVGILLTASRWGSLAIAIIYFAVSGVAGLLWAITIFHAQRKLHLGDGGDLLAMPFCPASAADSGRFAPQNHGMERGAQ